MKQYIWTRHQPVSWIMAWLSLVCHEGIAAGGGAPPPPHRKG